MRHYMTVLQESADQPASQAMVCERNDTSCLIWMGGTDVYHLKYVPEKGGVIDTSRMYWKRKAPYVPLSLLDFQYMIDDLLDEIHQSEKDIDE